MKRYVRSVCITIDQTIMIQGLNKETVFIVKNMVIIPGQLLQIIVNHRKWVENERFVQELHCKRRFLCGIQV